MLLMAAGRATTPRQLRAARPALVAMPDVVPS
jgi:hypothetical protein